MSNFYIMGMKKIHQKSTQKKMLSKRISNDMMRKIFVEYAEYQEIEKMEILVGYLLKNHKNLDRIGKKINVQWK